MLLKMEQRFSRTIAFSHDSSRQYGDTETFCPLGHNTIITEFIH